MVNKVEIGTLTQVSNNEHNFLKALNQNFVALQQAINDTLSRSGVTPNQMQEVLDMNGKRVINVGPAIEATDAVTKQDIQDIIDRAEQAISGVDQIIVAAKQALEAYAQEYIYPTAQAAVDAAVAAKEAAEHAVEILTGDPRYQTLVENIDTILVLAENVADITTLADNIEDIQTVADVSTAISAVAAKLTAIEGVYASLENIEGVFNDLTNINTVATNINAINAIKNALTAINAVAGSITNVNNVAAKLSDLNAIAENLTEILKASQYASQAATSASSASTSASNAATWAEGEDAAVEALGGEHSAKKWAEIAEQSSEGKQDKLTSANAGENVTITEVAGVVKINAEAGVTVITLTGESGTLTAEQIAMISEGCNIVCDGEVFRLSDESSTLSYKTFVCSNAATTETMIFKAIFVQLAQGTVNYGRWSKEAVPVSAGATYTAGDNIQISPDNVISATDTTYTAGTGINISNGVISATGGGIETYQSLSEAQRTVLLSTGKYHDADVENNTIFETDRGTFEKFIRNATPGTVTWTAKRAITTAAPWTSIAYGGGSYVVVARSDSQGNTMILYSSDGDTWHYATQYTAYQLQSVAYGNGTFVAIDTNNKALYSTDGGHNWTQTTLPGGHISTIGYWKAVTYGNDKFVAIEKSRAAYSSDGTSWTEAAMPHNTIWRDVTYGNGTYVTVGDEGSVAYSTNGTTWTDSEMPDTSTWSSVAYGNGLFVAVSLDSNKAAYSSDGINWELSGAMGDSSWISVAYGNGVFVAVNNSSSTAVSSTDGINWIPAELPQPPLYNWQDICYGADAFVAIPYNGTYFDFGDVAEGPGFALVELGTALKNKATGAGSLAIGTSAASGASAAGAITLGNVDNTVPNSLMVSCNGVNGYILLQDGLVPTARLATGGTEGQVVRKTATGMEWSDDDVTGTYQAATKRLILK